MGEAARRGTTRRGIIRGRNVCRCQKTSDREAEREKRQAWSPQGVRRCTEADVGRAEEAVGGQTKGCLTSADLGQGIPQERHGMKPDEVAKLVLDIERSVQMRTMLRQLATNQEVDFVEEWNEIEQLDLEIARKIRKRPIE
jgi:hypothetical protein